MNIFSPASILIRSAFKDSKKAVQLKDDFIGAFIDWIRPLFLKEDPKLVEKLETQADDPATQKRLEVTLEDMLENADFRQQLEAWLQRAQQRRKNVIEDAEIDTEGGIHIGDRQPESSSDVDEKNIIKGGKFKSKGDFHLGDG